MAIYKIFRGKVKKGKFTINKREEFRKAVNDLAGSDREIAIAVGNYEELISKSQFGYYWGYLIKEISLQTGERPKRLSSIFEHIFLSEGEELRNLSKSEFHNFILQIIALVADFNIIIYYPDEVMIPNYRELYGRAQ